MTNTSDSLEERCEDAVFQICCTREHYSIRCANQLEKYIKLNTNKHIAEVQVTPVPKFNNPIITEEQRKLFKKSEVPSEFEIEQTSSTNDVKAILNRLKELKSIVKQIEKSNNSDIYQLLK